MEGGTTTTTETTTTPPASPPTKNSLHLSTTAKKRQRIACDNCRQRKSRCDGTLPCRYCKDKGASCRYAEPTRRGPISKKECNNGVTFSVFTEYKMMQTLETKQYITLYMEHVNPLFPVCSEGRLMNPQSTAQKTQSYVALAFISQVYCDYSQSKIFMMNAKQLASSFFDEPSIDAAIATTMMGQYWFNLTGDHVNASQYSSLGYSLAKHLPTNPMNALVRNYSYFFHILLDPALSPAQTNTTMTSHIPTLRKSNWVASDIFGDHMLIVSKVIRYLRVNLSVSSTFANLCLGRFSEVDRADIISSINQLDYKLINSPRLPESIRTFYTLTARMSRSYVEWKSGHLDVAGEVGVQVLHLFISLQAVKKLHIMLVDRPYITVEFCGLVVCAIRESGRQQEADELLAFLLDYFPAICNNCSIKAQIDAYFQSTVEAVTRPTSSEVAIEDPADIVSTDQHTSSPPPPPPPHPHPPYPPSWYLPSTPLYLPFTSSSPHTIYPQFPTLKVQPPFSPSPIYLSPNLTLNTPTLFLPSPTHHISPPTSYPPASPYSSSLPPSTYYVLPPPPPPPPSTSTHVFQLQK